MLNDKLMIKLQRCRRCGKCCENLVINVCYSDIIRWFNNGRNDILQEVSFINNYPKNGTGGFYITKTALNPKQACPFLITESDIITCSIHDTKPKACIHFPASSEKVDFCLVSKVSSKETREQLKKDQRKDFKMAHDNWQSLLAILVQARNEHVGN